MGMRKNLFEIYKKFGHAPSKSFASPVLGWYAAWNDLHGIPSGSRKKLNLRGKPWRSTGRQQTAVLKFTYTWETVTVFCLGRAKLTSKAVRSDTRCSGYIPGPAGERQCTFLASRHSHSAVAVQSCLNNLMGSTCCRRVCRFPFSTFETGDRVSHTLMW